MINNGLKILAPIVGTVFAGTFGYNIGKLQANSAKEIAEIQAKLAKDLAEMASNSGLNKINNELDLIRSKLNASYSPFDMDISNVINKIIKLEEIIKSNLIDNNSGYVNSPLEISWLKDLVYNFDFENILFDELMGFFLFFGSVTSLLDRKSTRLNSSHVRISYAVFCLIK